ncbi:cactin-like [Hibiscus syriacus]|uniref:RNA helicase n=1 Tax=Hibiscus syriacus TaxID=106335 RepID=A0A6A2Y0C4_HIBSY|nr:cactin-like [Hibiscus syriacus]
MILDPPYKDLIAQAHNSSGKTACFMLGMLFRVDPKLKALRHCVFAPLKNWLFSSIHQRLPIIAQVVIGTLGTIKIWMLAKKLVVSFLKILVFDEADHMLAEDGFKGESLYIMENVKNISSHCQVLLFSATFNEIVKNYISIIVSSDHNQLFIKKEELSLESVKQYQVNVPYELSKDMVVKDIIFEFGERVEQTIIFVRTRNSATMLHKSLAEFGYDYTTIQGALKQEDRDKIVKEFKDGLTQVLISTDLLARGFDQQQVNLVINYDLPVKHDKSHGALLSCVQLIMSDTDEMIMSKIENHFGTKVAEVPDWRSEENFKAVLRSAGLL